jgi:Na+-driven multidrug efflux pump/anti-sigma regulatory factor (Ser/Thr protein kinase)
MEKKTSDYKLLTGLFFRLLPYQVLLLIVTAVNGIVDSLFASNIIGESAMSAIGLFSPMNHFLYAACMIFVSGSTILYGQYLARERNRINHLFTVTLVVSGGVALLASGLLVLSVIVGWTRAFVDEQPVLQMFNDYILSQAIGIPALIIGQQMFAFMSMENRRKWTMTASIICLAANLLGDLLFIKVIPMGTFGLGLSTSVSEWVFFLALALYYIRGKSEWKFSLKGCQWQDAPKIVKLGYSGALSRFAEMFRCLVVNFLVLKYVGSVGLSSFAASNSFLAVVWPIPFGMTAVARMLFSVSIGEEDRRSVVDIMKIVMTKGMLVVLAIVAGLVLFAEPLTRLFYRDPLDPVYQYTVMGFRLLPLCMPLAVLSLHYAAYCQVAQKKVMSAVLPIFDGFIGVVACSLFLIPLMQMNGLYLANILNGFICAAVILIGAWLALKRFPRNLEDLMAIPENIGVSAEDRIDISITCVDEVVNVSQKICDFCKAHGIDERRSIFSGLCMEEMAGNVVEHGFHKDNKKHHTVDVRVMHKEGDIILRIRDDCKSFDPSSYVKMMDPGENGKNAGIQLVYKIAREVRYQNLLGLNMLTIRL